MTDVPFRVLETEKGLEVHLHAQPRARRSEIAGIYNGALKIKITAPPTDDAANCAIVDFFAALLGVPKSRVRITAGLKSRNKTLFIEGISADSFVTLVNLP